MRTASNGKICVTRSQLDESTMLALLLHALPRRLELPGTPRVVFYM